MDRTAGLDRFLAGLDYPMVIVTAVDRTTGARAGCLVGFSTQASIDPPRYLVCISEKNATHAVALNSDVLAVHGPGRDRHDLAELFGHHTGDEIDKFTRCSWRPGPGGVPLLDDCPRWFVGKVLEHHPYGDHTGFLLEAGEGAGAAGVAPLMFSDVEDIDAGHDA